jgi:hypothetical protein
LQFFFNACNPSLPWSPSSSRTYRSPLILVIYSVIKQYS